MNGTAQHAFEFSYIELGLVALVGAGAIFFLVYWIGLKLSWRRLTPVDQAEIVYNLSLRKERRTLSERIYGYMRRYTGVEGAGNVLAAAWLLAFTTALAVSLAFRFAPIAALFTAVTGSLVVMAVAARMITGRRVVAFERQLMNAMKLLANQLESGAGLRKAIEKVVTVVEDPLQREWVSLLQQLSAGTTLVEGMQDLYERYPSPGMRLFVAALEADAASPGGRLAPVLRSISEGLEKEFELRAEANAELAQSRYEFYGIIAGLTGVGFIIYRMGGETTRDAFNSPLAWVVLGVLGFWALVGVWRMNRLFAEAGGQRRRKVEE